MICELCGIKTQINWGDGETVLCEPCSNSDQGKEIRIRRQNSMAKTIEVAVVDPIEYGASAQDNSYLFQWWTKHPWVVFWGITIFGGPLVLNTLKRLQAFSLPDDLSLLGTKICVWAGIALWLGSFIYAVSVTGKRSKSKAVIAVVLFVIGVGGIAIPRTASMRRPRLYVEEIRSDMKKAAHAQESYFDKNNSFKSCVACTSRDLPGFRNTSKVTLNAEVGRTDFVLVATHEQCGDSQWIYRRSTGKIIGPSPYDGC